MIEIKPRYQETDQMGVIHHSSYYAWFELGRDALFDSLKVPYKLFESKGIHMKVLESKCKYLESVHYDQMVSIVPQLIFCNGIRTLINFTVKSKDTIHSQAEITYVFTDFNGKLINMKKHYSELVKDLL